MPKSDVKHWEILGKVVSDQGSENRLLFLHYIVEIKQVFIIHMDI